MDENILRALLVSSGNKSGMPLRELKQNYFSREGKQEIPLCGRKSIINFLISSGKFILKFENNGQAMVREKPKIRSLQTKTFLIRSRLS